MIFVYVIHCNVFGSDSPVNVEIDNCAGREFLGAAMDGMSEPPDDDMWEIGADEEEHMMLANVEAEYAAAVEASRAAEAIISMEYDEAEVGPPACPTPLLPHISEGYGSSSASPSRSSTSDSVVGSSPVQGGAAAVSSRQGASGSGSTNNAVLKVCRRRLRGKAPAAGYYAEVAKQKALDNIASSLSHPAYEKYRKMAYSKRRQLNKAFALRKNRLMQKFSRGETISIGNETLRLSGIQKVASEKKTMFLKWLRWNVKHGKLNDDMLGVFIAQLLPYDRDAYSDTNGNQMFAKDSLLLTWQGPWGCLFDLDKIPTQNDKVDSIIPRVRQESKQLWTEFRDHGRLWAESQNAMHYAQSLELCCQTMISTGKVRVHLHAWFCFRSQKSRKDYVSATDFVFKNTRPVPSAFAFSAGRGNRNFVAGAFYLTAPKIGSICSYSTMEMFHDYAPQASWVTSMVGSMKIDAQVAESLYAKCITDAKRNIETLRYVQSFLKQRAREEERLRIENTIRAGQKPFKKIEAVDKWLEQYEEIRDRYLFLVLDGDSQYGKSRFAASLTTAEKFFLVDCSSATEPELRLFDRELHDVVCFDEAKPSMIIRVKKLAQAGVDMARLGQSSTNLVSYQVWFHRVKLVICSNGWEIQLRDLPPEDVAWLKKNSVYVKVTEPLFE